MQPITRGQVEQRKGIDRATSTRGIPLCVTGASLFRVHPVAQFPDEYRDALPALAEAPLMERLTRFVGKKGATLQDNAATSIAIPLNRGDAELISSQALSIRRPMRAGAHMMSDSITEACGRQA